MSTFSFFCILIPQSLYFLLQENLKLFFNILQSFIQSFFYRELELAY